MPINIKQFETAPEDRLRAGGETNAERVLSFLSATPEKAYTPGEIREAIDISRGSIGVVLSRLEDRGLVRHRGEYWAIADVDDAVTTLSASTTARAATERFGPENPDDWGPGATDESDDPTGE